MVISVGVGVDEIFSGKKFNELGKCVDSRLLNSLEGLGYEQATRVQEHCITQLLSNKDVLVQAPTGSGKTLAYVIPLLETILKEISHTKFTKRQFVALVIVPTRELALQINKVFTQILQQLNNYLKLENCQLNNEHKPSLVMNEEIENVIRHILFVGGTEVNDDLQAFCEEGAHIVIGTPGRLEHLLMNTSIFDSKKLKILILDEADQLLDMGFEKSLFSIVSRLPRLRRTGIFSATMCEELSDMERLSLINPIKIIVRPSSSKNDTNFVPQVLSMYYLICNFDEKLPYLINLLISFPNKRFIIYFPTCYSLDYFYKILTNLDVLNSFKIIALHGKMPSKVRKANYRKIDALGTLPLVVLCTDVAARGLDLLNLDWVVQLDAPHNDKTFIHRSGRAGRLNIPGNVLLFLSPNETLYLDLLKRRNITLMTMPALPFESPEIPKNCHLSPETLTAKIQAMCIGDRDIYERSMKAFVSWCRHYKEHTSYLIFKFSEVNLKSLVRMFGLIKLPNMPELKKLNLDFEPVDIDINSIKYKNPAREKKRLRNMTIPKLKPAKIANPRSIPWSKKKELKQRKLIKKSHKDEKRFHLERSLTDHRKKTDTTEENNSQVQRRQVHDKLDEIDIELIKDKKRRTKNKTEINLDWHVDQCKLPSFA